MDHVTVFRWVQPFTPLLIDAACLLASMPSAAMGELSCDRLITC